MSVDALARAVGVAVEHIDALEQGRLDPTYEIMLDLAEELEVDLVTLVALAEELGD